MAINVFPWPPVGAVGAEWTLDMPVSRLRSAITGRDQMQASQRRRRIATVEVSALANGRMGAGYCEMLKQLLDGGIHAVRLQSSPINWWLDELRRQGLGEGGVNSYPLTWRTNGNPLAWQTDGNPLNWYSGTVVTGGVPGEFHMWGTLTVTGLPPRTLVARPGDFIRVYDMSDASIYEIARVVAAAVTDGSGSVTLKLDRVLTISNGRVNLAGQDEGVFRADSMPRAVQPIDGDWKYTWNFREVFADEVGGFMERTPWT